MSSLPLYVAANYFLLDFYWSVLSDPGTLLKVENNDHYLYYSESIWDSLERWKLYTALMLGSASSLLSTYNNYAAEEDYNAVINSSYTEKYGVKLEFIDVLAASWMFENIFNFEFFPAYPMFAILGTGPDDYRQIGTFFTQESVLFLGIDVPPAAGAAMALGSSLLLANMSTMG